MRKHLVLYIFCFALVLNGCATNKNHGPQAKNTINPGETRVSFATPRHHPKLGNPVSVYSKNDALSRPYRIIGKEVVSRYNFIGLERQENTVNEIMKNLAASMGGDAVINVTADNQKVEGTVISYERVLL